METAKTKKYDLDRVVRMVLTTMAIVAAVLVINYLSPVLLPFVVGFILAYMLNPMTNWIQRLVRSRIVAVILTLVIVIVVIAGACQLLFPYVAKEFADMAQMLTKYAKSNIHVPYIPKEVQNTIREWLDVEKIGSLLSKEQWVKVGNQVLSGTWSFLGGTMSLIMSFVSWLIVLLYMFFVLLDFEKISRSFKGAIPKQYRRKAFTVIGDVETTMSRYFRGQALVSFFVGVIFAIEFYIIGLPMGILFGLSIGVLNMIPYLQLVSIPIAAFLCFVASVATGGSFWVLFGWTFAAYCICQLIQDMVLVPAIMKQQMGLNPAIIFLSLSVWAYVLGLIGLLIALPLTSLIISYYCEYVLHQPNPLHQPRKKPKKTKARKAE